LLKSDNTSFQWDKKLQHEVERRSKGVEGEERKRMIEKYVTTTVPADNPLKDEKHREFYHKYREAKSDILNKDVKFGAPLSTEEMGEIREIFKPKPE
jgi:hypothetical protein